jgi:methionyl aminopeptidase
MPGQWRSFRAISLRPCPRRLATSQYLHLPRRSGVTRSVSSTPGNHRTVAHDEENDTSELDAEVFGTYSVILPPEPFIFGVSHIPQRPVPSHIARPPYITPSAHGQPVPYVSSGDGRIQLGSLGEWRLRRAAQLAREVLEYAGTLVKVRAGIVVF